MDADTLAKQQQEQDAMVEEQKQARPLLQKQNEMSLLQNQPVLVDNDEELDQILEVRKVSQGTAACYISVSHFWVVISDSSRGSSSLL